MDPLKKFENNLITSKDKLKTDSAQVGKAVYDILQKNHNSVEVQEIINEYEKKYAQEIEKAINDHVNVFDPPFYIVVLSKKEPWALNVMRNWFITRQTRPTTKYLRHEYPNYMSTVYSFDKRNQQLKILWSLPIKQDAAVIMKNRHLYDPQLVQWIDDCNKGLLDKES